jgi:hypothetical protein
MTVRIGFNAAGGWLVKAFTAQAAVLWPTMVVLVAKSLAIFSAAGAHKAALGVRAHVGAGAHARMAIGAASAAGALGEGRVVWGGAVLVGATTPRVSAAIPSPVARTVVCLTTIVVSVIGPRFIEVGPIISGVTADGGIGATTIAGFAVVDASHYCSR